MAINKKTSAAVVAACVTALCGFEGMVLKPYRDIVGVVTVCIGETDKEAVSKAIYTPAECKALLAKSLPKYDDGMKACLTGELPDGMHVAFLSATYNIGVGAFCKSSMARKFNAGDNRGACDALMMWNRAGGREVGGLTRRRQAERKMCLEGL